MIYVLTFFPTAYPDELLYSVSARYHVRSGNTSPKMTIKELFGTSSVTAIVDMPSCINSLVDRLPKEKRIKTHDLIMKNTLFPYYTAFLPEYRTKAVRNTMEGNKGSAIHTMTGIMASSIISPEYLRFCPICIKEDKARYGELYWHRLHQIPGVCLCPTHGVMLQNSTVKISNRNRHEFIPADELNCIIKPEEIKYSDVDIRGISLSSIDVYWVIKNYNTVRKYVNANKGFKDVYLSALKKKGFATATGRVYQKEFISSFIAFYGLSFLKMVQSEVDKNDYENSWLLSIVRKHRKSFHPMRHLLLMRFLSGSAEEFIRNSNAYLPFGKGPWPCLNPAAAHYKELIVKNIKITHCLDTKLPVGTFTCSCGFIYSRRGPDVFKNDLYKIGRIKQFGSVWEEKLSILSEDDELSLRERARILKVDPKTVRANLQKLRLNINCPEKVNNVNLSTGEDVSLLDFHRNAWMSVVKENQEKSKTELRKLAKSNYAWLYRHDREWLDENSPKHKNIIINAKRVNWGKRDIEILTEIKHAVKGILEMEGKPVRVSLSRIGKNIGKLGLLQKHLDKMPISKAYVQKIIDTDIAFRERRIRWALEKLDNSGTQPEVWRAMRMAGIRTEYFK
ncbi:MAG: TnsD family transposase [Bacillota bacterium]|nr:TnsD family transposase [Bacillota bacterium]